MAIRRVGCAASLLVATIASLAFVADTVTQAVTHKAPPPRAPRNLALASVTTTHIAKTSTDSMTLTGDDRSCTSTGSNG